MSPAMPVFREIPLDAIQPDPQNPRRRFDEEELRALAASIEQDGVLQPILVRPGPGPQPNWVIVAGERRWRAAKLAGLRIIPAMVHSLRLKTGDSAECLRLALVENLQRQNLSPLEEAQAYADLATLGLKRTEIAAAVKRSVPVVKNALRLLRLPPPVQEHVRDGRLSASHARALCRYEGFPALQARLADLAVTHGWTSRDLDSHALPAANLLLAEGLIACLPLEREPFASTCRACPFDAFHATGGYCLRPEHARTLGAATVSPSGSGETLDAADLPGSTYTTDMPAFASPRRNKRRSVVLRLKPSTAQDLLRALLTLQRASGEALDSATRQPVDLLRRRLEARLEAIMAAPIESAGPPFPA
ncbi:MAG TPA: ParB/RepB/Spo0J family partition protein [Chloroflexota bacterium]|nr:ParB/RepB/Spo0J family partition protein [Chloroflexota bacterium]